MNILLLTIKIFITNYKIMIVSRWPNRGDALGAQDRKDSQDGQECLSLGQYIINFIYLYKFKRYIPTS
jgi:hypothetical protein